MSAFSEPLLITGVAGFIGMQLCRRLLDEGYELIGIDSLNDYYDIRLKQARLAELEGRKGFSFRKLDTADREATAALFAEIKPKTVVHLAAQAGVRYSLEKPLAYADSNLTGFLTVLEGCRHHGTEHLVYASSSSVYGGNTKMPFSTADRTDHPVSLYAASKKANELMAHAYSHLYGLPTTGLRFFTVYGPWGRPDMVPFIFTPAILEGRPIKVFNHGQMRRDFTYIDDIIAGVRGVMDRPARSDDCPTDAPHQVYNIGNNRPEALMDVIGALEDALGVEAKKEMLPMQPGDVPATYADIEPLAQDCGFAPKTDVHTGMQAFADWYKGTWLPIIGG